jgi:basic amino acid/polyamine antiporter, APA family
MPRAAQLARRLGSFDVALIVMGSLIGSGIFRAPAVVAQRAPAPSLILMAWAVGGLITLFGAFVLAELGARRPDDCGPYAYLRDTFHPVVGFAYGWASLLAASTGGLSAAAILFAGYFLALTGLTIAPAAVAATTLAVLAILNALGVRQGASAQNALTALKLSALGAVVVLGLLVHSASHPPPNLLVAPAGEALGAFSAALIPVLFAYAGAHVVTFMAAETRNAARVLPVGLTVGVAGVAIVYVIVNAVCLRVLGVAGLAHTDVPVSQVISSAVGPTGSRLAALAIALTTMGFMSNRMLTVPRLYHAMASDGLFFRAVAWVDPRTRVPTVAVVLQAVVAIAIALSAAYGHILNYVVSVVYAFNGLLALAIFVVRAQDRTAATRAERRFRVPWHPVSTGIYLVASWGVAVATCITYPLDGLMGLAITLSAVPVYLVCTRRRRVPTRTT